MVYLCVTDCRDDISETIERRLRLYADSEEKAPPSDAKLQHLYTQIEQVTAEISATAQEWCTHPE